VTDRIIRTSNNDLDVISGVDFQRRVIYRRVTFLNEAVARNFRLGYFSRKKVSDLSKHLALKPSSEENMNLYEFQGNF